MASTKDLSIDLAESVTHLNKALEGVSVDHYAT